MSGSDNLSMPRLTTNQSGKEVTINDAIAIADSAITELFVADVTSGNVTLTAAQFQQMVRILVMGASVNGRTVTVPAKKKWFIVTNDDGSGTKAISLVRGATSLTVASGQSKFAYTDGTTDGLVFLTTSVDVIPGGIGTPVAAGGSLTMSGNFSDTETVTVGSVTYTAQTSFTNGLGHFLIGATALDSLTNLARCINQSGSGGGTLYDVSSTDQNEDASATEASPMVATARLTGSEGNSIATTETTSSGSWGAATLTGGKSQQVLGKASDDDYDLEWVDLPREATAGSGSGGAPSFWQHETPAVADFGTVLGSVTGVTTTDNADYGILHHVDVANSNAVDVRGRVRSVPGGSLWSAQGGFMFGMQHVNFMHGGLLLRESSTSKLISFGYDAGAGGLSLIKFSNLTTFSATYESINFGHQQFMYLRVDFDNTNYTWYYGPDGKAWTFWNSHAKADFFTTAADQVGFHINPQAQGGAQHPQEMGLVHWVQA